MDEKETCLLDEKTNEDFKGETQRKSCRYRAVKAKNFVAT